MCRNRRSKNATALGHRWYTFETPVTFGSFGIDCIAVVYDTWRFCTLQYNCFLAVWNRCVFRADDKSPTGWFQDLFMSTDLPLSTNYGSPVCSGAWGIFIHDAQVILGVYYWPAIIFFTIINVVRIKVVTFLLFPTVAKKLLPKNHHHLTSSQVC